MIEANRSADRYERICDEMFRKILDISNESSTEALRRLPSSSLRSTGRPQGNLADKILASLWKACQPWKPSFLGSIKPKSLTMAQKLIIVQWHPSRKKIAHCLDRKKWGCLLTKLRMCLLWGQNTYNVGEWHECTQKDREQRTTVQGQFSC